MKLVIKLFFLLSEFIKCLIVFQVSLNFDPVKEILKIGRQIYILTKKEIILRKLFQFLIKLVVKRAMRKKLNAFTLQLVIYYILE